MFKSWCSKNNFKNAKATSHVLMDGGVLSIPFDKLDEFCERYVEAVKNKEKLYLVEQKTPTYNFFLDIDYKDEKALDIPFVQKLCRIICDKVKTLGGKDCLICVSKPKEVDDNLIKTGVHMNWPGFVVDQENALNVREHVIATLKSIFKNKSWNQIIDCSVYGDSKKRTKGSGFRIPWSYKKGKHLACGGQGCSGCDDNGKVTELPYVPVFKYVYGPVLCLMNTVSQENEPSIDTLKMSIIRTEDTNVRAVRPLDGKKREEGSFTQTQMKDEFDNSEAIAHLETFIRKNLEGQEDARITKVFTHKNHFLVSSSSKYCENIGRSHNSNHIWFHVVGDVIIQKCFCTCETVIGRKNGFCADFRGEQNQLPASLVSKLYPNAGPPKRSITPPIKQKLTIDDAIPVLNEFINKNIQAMDITNLSKKKGKYIATTTVPECELLIDKTGIDFVYSKTPSKNHRSVLNKKSKEILFPDKK